MIRQPFLLFFILGIVMVLSVAFKKLTVAASLAGGLVGWCVYAGAGFTGLALLGAFFILGIAATAHKRSWKQELTISKKEKHARTAGQVFANGGLAGILGMLILFLPQHAITLQLMLAASLSSATADTVSSELGMVYGRRFYNIHTGQKEARGLDGVVSVEGLLLGMAGSILIAFVYCFGFGFGASFLWIVVAGTAGNLVDSYLGAVWERKNILTNNAVNFLNTVLAALTAWILSFL